MAEGGTPPVIDAADLEAQVGTNQAIRPQTAPRPGEEGDEHPSFRDVAIDELTKLQNSQWYVEQGSTMKGLMSAALCLLRSRYVSDLDVNYIIAGLVMGGFVFKGLSLYKPYATGQFVPFKDRFDLVIKWLSILEEKEEKITRSFEELEKHLKAVAEKEEDKFESQDWMQYKTTLKLIEDDLAEFVQILDRIKDTPDLNCLLANFDENDERYIKECSATKKAWSKFFRRSSYAWLGATGFGTLMAWQLRKLGDINIAIALAALAVGPLAFGLWAREKYHSDTDIEPLLKNLRAKITYFEGKKEDFKLNLRNKNAADLKRYLEDFSNSMTKEDPHPRSQPHRPEQAEDSD